MRTDNRRPRPCTKYPTIDTDSADATIAPLKSAKAAHFDGLTSWRGRSGRRYIVSVYDNGDVPDYPDAVLIAVGRSRPEGRRILAVATDAQTLSDLPGCREIHVHLLARNADDRHRILADLTPHPKRPRRARGAMRAAALPPAA